MSNTYLQTIKRREFLGIPVSVAFAGLARSAERKKIAAIITEYRTNSHADVIVGRMLYGYGYYGEHREPSVKVMSMYTDQVPENDMSRTLAVEHGFTIYPTVEEALTMGGQDLAVEGVVFIGEHGDYPLNEKGQKLYPRYRLYKDIIDTFKKTGRSLPVFSDKHLSTEWDEAKWMYDQSVEMGFPLMAGSSLPVWWRYPELELEKGTPVEKAVVTSYGGKESYGFHALECLQCIVERRDGGETGIVAVQCLEGTPVWNWTDANPWAVRLLEHALAQCPESKAGSPRNNVKSPILFILEYNSGLQAAVYLLNGQISSWALAADISGSDEPLSFQFRSNQGERPYAHFSPLVYYIGKMMVTNKPSYPPERTLLTTGAISTLIDSSYRGNIRIETPFLDIAYNAPVDSLFWRMEEPTGIQIEKNIAFTLLPNTPNPFNPITTIHYTIPTTTHVNLTIYNVMGQTVKVVKDGVAYTGRYSYTWNAIHMPSGYYFCTLRANGVRKTIKMMLIK
ncbi:T9SS type A sorting domain-containing protein [Candidatus Latescibacterota bacterium]